jgi:hypothetical protein
MSGEPVQRWRSYAAGRLDVLVNNAGIRTYTAALVGGPEGGERHALSAQTLVGLVGRLQPEITALKPRYTPTSAPDAIAAARWILRLTCSQIGRDRSTFRLVHTDCAVTGREQRPVGKQDVAALYQRGGVPLRAVSGQLGDDDARAGLGTVARDQRIEPVAAAGFRSANRRR